MKDCNATEEQLIEAIYIPVWIDLKVCAKITKSVLLHLHSSMDRFEANTPIEEVEAEPYLHSSMDRFEAYITVTAGYGTDTFTFQYG